MTPTQDRPTTAVRPRDERTGAGLGTFGGVFTPSILTMFFLTTYLVLNIAAGVERFLGSPSFRPSFRVHWALSLLGAAGCLVVMFLINTLATVIAAVVVLAVFIWLERRELRSAWGDVRNGIWMALVRSGLLRIETRADMKNWRPSPLVLSGAPTRRWHLIDLANALTHSRGLITVASVLPAGSADATRQAKMETAIRDYLARRDIQGFVRLIEAEDPFTGAERLVDAYGFGPLVPNSVILGASEEPAHRARYCRMITSFHRAGRNVLVLRSRSDRDFGRRRRIDVWWGGLQANGGLMLVLAYMLRTSVEWAAATVTVKLVVGTEPAAEAARRNLEEIVERLRIGARVDVLVSDRRPFEEILHDSSADADLVFLGMAAPEDGGFLEYYDRLQDRTAGLPTTVFVLAAPGMAFAEVLF